MADQIALPEELANHRQLHGNFCAASGFECIAKLHRLIPKDQFPLQSDSKNQGLGFGRDDAKFLSQWFDCKDGHFDVEAAMAFIEQETNEGRFPLVSLYEWNNKDEPIGWHVFLLLQQGGKLLLVDPRQVSVTIDDRTKLRACLQLNSLLNPERKTLHLFWYQVKSNS